jgi:hypothetical protein
MLHIYVGGPTKVHSHVLRTCSSRRRALRRNYRGCNYVGRIELVTYAVGYFGVTTELRAPSLTRTILSTPMIVGDTRLSKTSKLDVHEIFCYTVKTIRTFTTGNTNENHEIIRT